MWGLGTFCDPLTRTKSCLKDVRQAMVFFVPVLRHQWAVRFVFLFAFLLVTPFAFPLSAQQSRNSEATQAVSGSVFDPSSAAIPDARISLFTSDGRLVAITTTDRAGLFHLESIPRGKYRVQIQSAGFKDALVDISVGTKTPAPLKVTLSILSVSETVSVDADDSTIQVSTNVAENQNANNIDHNALDRVPVFDQDYVTLLSRFLSDDSIGTNGVSLIVNGIEANGPGVAPSGVQEVKINQNPYSARFARPGRARLEIITKPGTPQFHGTLNFLFRDSFLDARNAFATTKPQESRYYTEGTLTGPLGHDKKNTFLLSVEEDNDNIQAIVHAFGPNGTIITDNVPAPTRNFFLSFRAFHDFATGDQFWIAYSYENGADTNQGVGGTVLREAGYNTESTESEINISYRHILSPKWVNQLRFLVGHNSQPVYSVTNAPLDIVEGYFTGGGAQMRSLRTEAHFDGTDLVTYSSGKHLLNFGVDVPDLSRRGADDFNNQLGTYTFTEIDSYTAGTPSNYSVQTGNGHLVFWERTVAGFIEDDIRVKPNFSMTLGLRYYYQNYFNNIPYDLAPRFGFALAPSQKSKTVFRGGAGIFYDRSGPRAIADLLHFSGNPNGLFRFILPLQTGAFVPYPVTLADLQGVPTSIVQLDPRARIPSIFQYSFGIERQITAKSTLSATYVGSRGMDLYRSRDINAPPPPDYLARPNAAFGQIRQMESEGYQKSNALEVTFRGKPTHYFVGQAQYTLGKTNNNTSGIRYFPGNSYYPWLDWARSDNDRRNKFDLLGTFDPTRLFSIGIALQAYSGKPVNVITGADANGDGIFNDRPLGGLAPRNSLHGPSLVNLDLNLQHEFKFKKEVKESPALAVTLNVFNVLNHVNDVTYNGVIGPNFGQPSSSYPARRFQVNFEFKF
jgi:hypothetical protein